ncbi:MAG TPA: DUF2807 domain-containing protein [Allosphingosinicella sp.]|nr:DUF2807 domain-containing protein [Allosphingosinicella sp.]
MRAALALLALALAAPASAATDVSVGAFEGVRLVGGGEVRLRHGPVQKVSLIQGSAAVSSFRVENGKSLVIRACETSCRNYKLVVEIVTPRIDAVSITGGGSIVSGTGFGAQPNLAASITGGGMLDLDSVPARHVAASIKGGGVIRTDARGSLAVSIVGGGSVTYLADPATTVAINGGGAVSRAAR